MENRKNLNKKSRERESRREVSLGEGNAGCSAAGADDGRLHTLPHAHQGLAGNSSGQTAPMVDPPWVLHNTEEVEIVDSTVSEPLVVDLTDQFVRIFTKTSFNSFEDFEDTFNQFKRETGSVFRIKSSSSVAYENSRRKKHFIPDRFKFVSVRYCCVHYGQPKIAGQGIRVKQRYLPCGCECLLSVSYSRGALVISQAVMQHNHEVSNDMAPYYAINRRITNRELREVADVIELIPSSRALQHFLQEHFHRPTTLQDAKNIKARLKALQVSHATKLSAVQSIKSDTAAQETKEENFEESDSVLVEDMEEEVVLDDLDNAKPDQPQQEKDHQQVEQEQSLQPKWKEKVINEIKSKLSDLIHFCDTNVFWERISVINKIIECWENGDNFDVHYASENVYNKQHTVANTETELSQIDCWSSSRQEKMSSSRGRDKRTPGVHVPSALLNSSESQMNFMLPVLSGTNMQFLPASLSGDSLKLVLPHRDNRVSNSASIQKKHPGRPRKNHLKVPVKKRKQLECSEKASSLHNHTSTCNKKRNEENSMRTSLGQAKQPIIMSVAKENSLEMCDQAMEVEIEISGDIVNVKHIKLEPLECHEVDVTDNVHQRGNH
nr:uncharacterized protein LOC123759979 [Procambarus clarkii]